MWVFMKNLKFVRAIPSKVLVRFYMFIETIFQDGKQKYRQLSRNIRYMGYKTRIMKVLFHEQNSPLKKVMTLYSMQKWLELEH